MYKIFQALYTLLVTVFSIVFLLPIAIVLLISVEATCFGIWLLERVRELSMIALIQLSFLWAYISGLK